MNEREFVTKWIDEIRGGRLKNFPVDFIDGYECEKFELPEAPLLLGSELFGSYEIVNLEGKPYCQVSSYEKAKFILYANRTRPAEAAVPVNHNEMIDAIKKYEKHIDTIVVEIERDFKNSMPLSKSFLEVSNQIFNSLKLQRYY